SGPRALEIRGAPDPPFARTANVSFVEVSPSTVIELNVEPTTSRRPRESSGGDIAASVATKASIVAILGWIMPEPFAQPRKRTSFPPIRRRAMAHFGRVSVVII